MRKLKMIFLAYKALKHFRKVPMKNVKNIFFAARRIKKRKN
ncbi:hypothetical protein HMPREF9225_1099 [Peptoniphilus duerdenii ATCC BAA-1640]|uniref:Uncharacterized protein n=1 Tax=Peptoniphilus duerdenii ATCC BAA-1640 TaxID=862517 RepID=E0NLZ9_9FIRM|nr:hypothetical protein [Peptoniphilus duerdenii]EFM25210.1 hypothetical protein HMPREF9225_1099 [Peptoniphilus duerdenii ATCC BAA-1640]